MGGAYFKGLSRHAEGQVFNCPAILYIICIHLKKSGENFSEIKSVGAFIVILNWKTQHGGLKYFMLNCDIGEINGPPEQISVLFLSSHKVCQKGGCGKCVCS